MKVLLLVGTDKGLFFLRSDAKRERWSLEGPEFKGWKVTTAARDATGNFLVGTASHVYGAAIHRSRDLEKWKQVANGPVYEEGGKRKLNQIWEIVCNGDRIFAGVDEAGLFMSTDGGEKFEPLDGLNEHSSREKWCPGNGGLCAHSVVVDPQNPDRIWCGISAVGVFRSDDGGATWHPKNRGVKVILEDEENKDIGFCVHALAIDPEDGNCLWRREHTGMFRSGDGGESWERIENGLPYWFGFPLVIDQNTKNLYAIPLESDEFRIPSEGRLSVYRSRDRGDSWQAAAQGLPESGFYGGVLRGAMDLDDGSPCGVYFGTTAGSLHITNDDGETWRNLPYTLPRILSVDAFVEE